MDLAAWAALVTLVCIGLQVYHYVIYPALLGLLAAAFARRPALPALEKTPSTSMIICAFNEAGVIARKIENSLALDPRPDEIIVVNDGSTDATLEIASAFVGKAPGLRVLAKPDRGGKSAAMNYGAANAQGSILVFSDASEMYEPQAIAFLLEEFRDPTVGVASGAHRLRPPAARAADSMTGKSEGLYWRYEDFIRRSESAIGSTVASVGSMLAIRREDWRPLPPGTVNDDAWITMSASARGRNVRFAHRAISWEESNESAQAEQVRRRRISAGRILLLGQREIWPLKRPAVLAAFLSHKVLRLALPILMIAGAVANLAVVLLDPSRTFFVVLLAGQAAMAGLAATGYVAERSGRRWRLPHLVYHVVHSNLTVLGSIRDIMVGKGFLKWDKPSR